MNKKVACIFVLALLMVFSIYAQQYNDENDFNVEIIGGNYKVYI